MIKRMTKVIYSTVLAAGMAITGCNTVSRTEYDAAIKKQEEAIQMLRDQLTAAENKHADLEDIVTNNTRIPELIPKVGEAEKRLLEKQETDKKELIAQQQKDTKDLTDKMKKSEDKVENTRRENVVFIEEVKRWLEQVAKPVIGKPEDAEGPATGVYAYKETTKTNSTRLANQKDAIYNIEKNLTYQREMDERSYKLHLDYRLKVREEMESLQQKLYAVISAKPEERETALKEFERERVAAGERIEQLYRQQKEERKKTPPRPEEKK